MNTDKNHLATGIAFLGGALLVAKCSKRDHSRRRERRFKEFEITRQGLYDGNVQDFARNAR